MEDQFVQAFKAKQGDKMAALYANDGWRITDMGPIIGKEARSNTSKTWSRCLT